MKNRLLYVLLFVVFNLQLVNGQTASRYQISFKDKGSLTLNDVSLSEKSLLRRTNQGIDLNFTDIPINPDYINQLLDLGITIKGKSRWLNTVTVKMTEVEFASVSSLPFIKTIVKSKSSKGIVQASQEISNYSKAIPFYNYGLSDKQIEQIDGKILHDYRYQGQGMTIAVFDAGFKKVDEHIGFSEAFINNQITAGPDFVLGFNQKVNYEHSSHGQSVLSTMLAYTENVYVGTAPKADYILIRTEDATTETLVEEFNWLMAAEYVDSVGVDLINSSLGYTVFNDTLENHTYADLDGNTTLITRAADLAAQKGILVVNSAGNSGGSPWYYISAPADADSILTVGAVNADGFSATFSSHGPTIDGRVKPNVVAHGSGVYASQGIDNYSPTNGTSFSGPIICGMTACLWQYLKTKDITTSNMDVIALIEKSAHLYPNYNEDYGYGIPNYKSIVNDISLFPLVEKEIGIFPNPFNKSIHLYSNFITGERVELISMTGQVIKSAIMEADQYDIIFDTEFLSQGMYFIKLHSEGKTNIYKVVK